MYNRTYQCHTWVCFVMFPIILKHVVSAHLHHDVANTQMQTHAMSSSSITFVTCFVLSHYKSVCSWAYFSHFCVRLPTVFQRPSLNTHGMLQMCRLWVHLTHHTSAASMHNLSSLTISGFLGLANGRQETLTSSSNKSTTYISYDSSFTCSDGTSSPIVVRHFSAQHAMLWTHYYIHDTKNCEARPNLMTLPSLV